MTYLNWPEWLEFGLFILLVIFIFVLLKNLFFSAQDKSIKTIEGAISSRQRSWISVPEVQVLIIALPLHFIWEVAQFPLYTIWHEGNWDAILFALVHCTLGDLLIMLNTFWIISLLNRSRYWIFSPSVLNVTLLTMFGLSYTIYSEIINIRKGAWAYTELMPIVPVLGVGGMPFLQWLLIPPVLVGLINLQKIQLNLSKNNDE